jgi:hypothetical protein
MTVVSTLDVTGLTAPEYRAVMDELGVEQRPEGGIYLHLTTPTDSGYRIVEIWDEKENFDRFVERRLAPANEAIGVDRATAITVTPLRPATSGASRPRELPPGRTERRTRPTMNDTRATRLLRRSLYPADAMGHD